MTISLTTVRFMPHFISCIFSRGDLSNLIIFTDMGNKHIKVDPFKSGT